MDGDTEGSGPVGGKFNMPAGTPVAAPSERQTITLSNGAKVTINRAIAGQFLGFFNDLIKFGAPVRGLGGFAVPARIILHNIPADLRSIGPNIGAMLLILMWTNG